MLSYPLSKPCLFETKVINNISVITRQCLIKLIITALFPSLISCLQNKLKCMRSKMKEYLKEKKSFSLISRKEDSGGTIYI